MTDCSTISKTVHALTVSLFGRSEHAFALASVIAVLGLVIGNCVLLYFGGKSAAAS